MFADAELTAFAQGLIAYPLSPPFPHIVGGYGTRDDMEVLVGLEVAPVGPHGQVGVHVHLATHPFPRDLLQAKQEVHLVLLTTYERLAQFSRDMTDMLEGRWTEARIDAELMIR